MLLAFWFSEWKLESYDRLKEFFWLIFDQNLGTLQNIISQKQNNWHLKIFCLSRGVVVVAGVAVRALIEICIDDISAVLRTTDLRFRLAFVSWAGLMHLIFRNFEISRANSGV
jgi:hypothetical protein